MPTHTTSKGRIVNHLHRLDDEPEIHEADLELLRRLMADQFPQAEIVKESTISYNCHGFALAPRHEGWFNFPDFFLSDDFTGTAESPQPGDVLIYGQNGVITHSAVVIEVSGGTIVRLQSKWGRVNEVKHPVDHVPEVYGEPIVLLRRRPGVLQHPAVSGGDAKATGGASGAESPADSAIGDAPAPQTEAAEDGTTATVSSSQKIPKRLMLMFASTPEVERQIRQSSESTQGRSVVSVDPPSPLDNSGTEAAETLAISSTETPSAAPDEIQRALAEFSSPLTQFQLMLASTPQVLREAASRLQPVQDLIELDKTNPGTRKAIVEFFERPEIQADEELTGITLFTLTKLPSKEAVPAISRYLEAGNFSPFNGSLAVEALKEAVAVATA